MEASPTDLIQLTLEILEKILTEIHTKILTTRVDKRLIFSTLKRSLIQLDKNNLHHSHQILMMS